MRICFGVLLFVSLIFACQSKSDQSSNDQKTSVVEKLEATAFKTALQADESEKIILDVRTAKEFNSGAIPNSINIDYLADGFGASVDGLDKSNTVYIYCQGGVRSSKAARIMEDKGFEKIIELKDGFSSY